MSPEELDRATADEAWRLWQIQGADHPQPAVIAARLAREGYRPPEPVDPDLLACREWMISQPCSPDYREAVLAGKWDLGTDTTAFLAGARMAREREQERARVLVEPAEAIVNRAVRGTGSNGARWLHIVKAARRLEKGLTAYKAGKEAGK
jgi:hypothetical protein